MLWQAVAVVEADNLLQKEPEEPEAAVYYLQLHLLAVVVHY